VTLPIILFAGEFRIRAVFETRKRWMKDGLSDLKYKLVKTITRPLFTQLNIDLLAETDLQGEVIDYNNLTRWLT
jgi:hypothetical protein